MLLADAFSKIISLRETVIAQVSKYWKFAKNFQYRRKLFVAGFYLGKKIGSTRLQRFFAKRVYMLSEIGNNVLVRYLFKELLLYFVVLFACFFVVFFVNHILLMAETILKKRVSVTAVIKLIIYCLPSVIAQSAPFATLVGFLMCLGRLVTDNEILIFRASGLRYRIILKSVLSLGLAISIFSFVMNDYFLPLGTLNYNKMYKKIIVSNPAVELESKSIKRMNDATVVVGEVSKNSVSDLVLIEEKDESTRFIVAQNSMVEKATESGVLMRLGMNDSLVMIVDDKNKKKYDVLNSDSLELNVFEDSIISYNGGTSPREMTSWDLFKKIREYKKIGSLPELQMNSYKVEYNKKFSIPFGSIFFAMLAFPLALVFGKKDGQTLGLIFGIIISVLYWAVTILGQMFGIRSGLNGFWVMWTPNFVLGIIGVLLYRRLRRK